MNTPIGDRLFHAIPRRVAKFRENEMIMNIQEGCFSGIVFTVGRLVGIK